MKYLNSIQEKTNLLPILGFVFLTLILYTVYLYNENRNLENERLEFSKTLDELTQNSIVISNQIQQKEIQSPKQNIKLKKKSHKKEIILLVILIFLIGILASTVFEQDP